MALDLEEIKVDPTAHWTKEFKDWFEFVKILTARIEASKKDITGNLGKDWYRIGSVYAIYGELGRDLFHRVTKLCPQYDQAKTDEKYAHVLKTSKAKTWRSLKDICVFHKIDIKDDRYRTETDCGYFLASQGFNEESILDARLHLLCDKDGCMYSINETRTDSGSLIGVTPRRIANFTMNIRYLIKDKERPLRIIDIKYKTPMGEEIEMTLACPTKELNSVSSFKSFIESHAGIIFKGNEFDLVKIKERFYPYEKAATQINVLGWYERDAVYFFNNGAIYEDSFFPADKDGFIEIDDKVFYMPSANQNNWYTNNDFSNKRNFIFIDNDATFETWAPLFHTVYQKPGMSAMVFSFACLFSDIIFNYLNGFPMPYLVGPPSGGKGSTIKSLQHLWGVPQSPMAIPGKKASDKAKVRKLAQICNGLVLLDEYPEYPTQDIEEGTKLLYDRVGDARAMKDYSYDTDEVPISSGMMLTSNYYIRNEALVTRVIQIEITETNRGTDAEKNFRKLKEMEGKGISKIAAHILHYRAAFRSRFANKYKECHALVSPTLKQKGVKEDRMIKSVAMLLAVYKSLEEHLPFPFKFKELQEYAVQSMVNQNSRRKTEDKVSGWWLIFLKNIKDRKLKHGFHFDIDADKLSIVWMDCYTEYITTFSQMNRQRPPGRIEILELHKSSEFYQAHKESYRFKNTEQESQLGRKQRNTSVMQFDINALHRAGFDIIYSTQTANEASQQAAGERVKIETLNQYEENLQQPEPADTPFGTEGTKYDKK